MAESLARQLRNPGLFSALYRFNYLMAVDLHPDWRAHFFPELPEAIQSAGVAQPRLSRYLAEQLALEEVADAEDARLMLAALPASRLPEFAFRMGLMQAAPRVRRLLERDEVSACRRLMGEASWQFALQHCRLLTASAEPATPTANDPALLIAQCQEEGWQAFWSIFQTACHDIRERVRIKMPPAVSAAGDDTGEDEAAQGGLKRALRLLRLTEPDWFALFATRRAPCH